MRSLLQPIAITLLLVVPLLLMNLDFMIRALERFSTGYPLLFWGIFLAPAIILLIRRVWKKQKR